jgi:putative hemolysin
MKGITTEIFLILLMVTANGIFAMAEIAIVSSRKARLQQRAAAGDAKAAVALEVASHPNRFLSTVQIGITLVGVLAGAFGGATLSKKIAASLHQVPMLAPYADSIGLGVVVVTIAYLSLVIGELVPKRIGLHSPERIASLVAGPMRSLSVVATPVVWFLSISTDLVLRVVGLRPNSDPPVTEEEIEGMIAQGTEAGVFAPAEQDIVGRVFKLGDRQVRSLMTRRPDIVWLDLNGSWEENRRKMTESAYSRFPVCRGGLDNVVGVVRAKDLLDECLTGQPVDIEASLRLPVFVPEVQSSFRLLETLKQQRTHIALAIDEHGSVEGLITLHDVLEALIGEMPLVDESDEPDAMQRADGSWLLDGLLSFDEFEDLLGLEKRWRANGDDYDTLAGFIMAQLGRIPTAGDAFEAAGLRFEVVDMDGQRVDKVLVQSRGDDASSMSDNTSITEKQ